MISVKNTIAYNININYPEFSDQHDVGEDLADANQKYTIKQAYSTIKHDGENGMGGHFFMDGKSERDGSSNRYNDGGIQEIAENGMPYLVFYRDMTPNELINQVLKKVSTNKDLSAYLDKIALKFSEWSKLDMEKKNKNESRRLRFSYLLMQAVLPDLIENKETGVRKYKLLPDNKISDLICAIFDLIKDEKNFNDNTMEAYRTAIQSEKAVIRESNTKEVGIEQTKKDMQSMFNQLMPSNIGQSNQYNPNASKISGYKPESKKILTWLKFIFGGLSAVGAIIAFVFDSCIMAAILVAVCLFIVCVPKFCGSGCCNLCVFHEKSKNNDNFYDCSSLNKNEPKLEISKDYGL